MNTTPLGGITTVPFVHMVLMQRAVLMFLSQHHSLHLWGLATTKEDQDPESHVTNQNTCGKCYYILKKALDSTVRTPRNGGGRGALTQSIFKEVIFNVFKTTFFIKSLVILTWRTLLGHIDKYGRWNWSQSVYLICTTNLFKWFYNHNL